MNSMGDAQCRPAYVEKLREYLRGHEGELCGDCLERIDINPLRTFDCKVESCRAVLDEAPRISDHLCPECSDHFDAVLALVRAAGLEPNLDFRLVRGLDYYTRTTFEFNSDRLGAQSGVGGGGRYDGLVEQLGGQVHAGRGLGQRRRAHRPGEARAARRCLPPPACSWSPSATTSGRRPSPSPSGCALRRCRRHLDLARTQPKGQLKQAGRSGARFAVLLGLDELADGAVASQGPCRRRGRGRRRADLGPALVAARLGE